MARNNADLGHLAEKLAAAYLELRGLEIREQNVRLRRGEIDIVARSGETWVFVEVRSRLSDDGISPLDSIGAQKRRRVRRVVGDYLERADFRLCPDFRIDVVGITLTARSALIEHLTDAL